MRRFVRVGWLAALSLVFLVPAAPARAQGFVFESTPRFDVNIVIEPSGDLLITETIVQEFGSTPRHGIIRFIPNRLRYDDEFDRVYPIELLSVTASPRTRPPTSRPRTRTATSSIRIGDPDTEITGRHTYEIVYRVQGAMNGFADHDELFWNAIGDQWEQSIGEMNVRVSGPDRHHARRLLPGDRSGRRPRAARPRSAKKGDAVFSQSNLPAFQAMSVVTRCRPGPSRAPRRSWTSASASTRRSAGPRSPWAGGWGCSSWWSGGSGS